MEILKPFPNEAEQKPKKQYELYVSGKVVLDTIFNKTLLLSDQEYEEIMKNKTEWITKTFDVNELFDFDTADITDMSISYSSLTIKKEKYE